MGQRIQLTKITNVPIPKYSNLGSREYRLAIDDITKDILEHWQSHPFDFTEFAEQLKRQRAPFSFRLATKIAHSYSLVQNITQKVMVSVIFPVYNEKNRLHTSKSHPHGENLLRTKIGQLENLSTHNKNLSWQMTIVDDGSDDGTGHIINFILEKEYPEYLKSGQVKVLFISDAIKQKYSYLEEVKSLSHSGKGSSITYGLDLRNKEYKPNKDEEHILIYTDADLSVHLGQIGIAINKILSKDCDAVIGQRRLKDSLIIRPKIKTARGKLYIYLLNKLIPDFVDFVIDPQAPLKAITSTAFKKISTHIREPGFAFDVEFLLLLKIMNIKTCPLGIAFVDSTKESHTKGSSVHLEILKRIIKIRKRQQPRSPADSALEKFISKLNTDQWDKLTQNVPEEIKKSTSKRLGKLSIPLKEFTAIAS